MEQAIGRSLPGSGTVAIIEDDPGIRDLVQALLAREGFEVFAHAGSAPLETSGVIERLDCLILDLMLPGEDGLVICQRLRARFPRLPILIVTAKNDPIDRIIGLEIGADDYLAKPFNARRYGGGDAIVHVTSQGNMVTIIVEDQGPGVPKTSLQRLLLPFVRLETSRGRGTGGVGLGLSIVQALARRYQGELLLANRPEGGFRASLILRAAGSH